MSIEIGKMRHRIEIQHFSKAENECGETINEWTTYKKLWSSKKQLKANIKEVKERETLDYTYRFTIRYNPNITENMRILHNNTLYKIKHVNHINELNLYETRLDCIYYKEGVENGGI